MEVENDQETADPRLSLNGLVGGLLLWKGGTPATDDLNGPNPTSTKLPNQPPKWRAG